MMMSNEMSPNEPQFWDIGVDNLVGGFNNHPYNNITSLPTTASFASTTALSITTVVTSTADYFSHQQPPQQRQSSLNHHSFPLRQFRFIQLHQPSLIQDHVKCLLIPSNKIIMIQDRI